MGTRSTLRWALALAALLLAWTEARLSSSSETAGGWVVGMRVLNAHGDWETAQKEP